MSSEAGEKASVRHGELLEIVLSAVARREGCDILDLPPLYEAVDPEAMAQILGRGIVDSVTFRYLDFTVTVTSDQDVRITEDERLVRRRGE